MRKYIITLTAVLAVLLTAPVFSADLLQVVRTNGVVESGQAMLESNKSYPINLPTTIVTMEKSSITALLPNGHGVFIGEKSVMTLESFSRESTPTERSWIGLLSIAVPRGNFALCAPEKQTISTFVRVTTRGTVILGAEESTYAVLGDQLTVTRGSVDVHKTSAPNKHTIVQAGESILLNGPVVVMPAKQSGGLSAAVLEATIDACSARMAPPSAEASPVEKPTFTFPVQPINPDIVSPSS